LGKTTDKDGQPLEKGFNWGRRRAGGLDELIGICRGVLADGGLSFPEVQFLWNWLSRNEPVRNTDEGEILFDTLSGALKSKALKHKDEDHLTGLLLKIVGGTPKNTPDLSYSTTLPLDDPPPVIRIPGKSFCFTGKFEYGSRHECEECIIASRGVVHHYIVQDANYLVIGLLGSRDWIHSTKGRKIEHAIGLRNDGAGIKIVAEGHWKSCLPAT
jgi:hypothetical protein